MQYFEEKSRTDAPEDPTIVNTLQWTVPVCNWKELTVPVGTFDCETKYEDDNWACMHKIIHKTCQDMFTSENDPWPYGRID